MASPAPDEPMPGEPAPAIVRGRVTDESGRPLVAAQVVAEGTGQGALIGQDGTFELRLDRLTTDPEGRNVTLTAQLLGYREASRALSMRGGDSVATAFRLAEEQVALDEFVVTGAAEERSRELAAHHVRRKPPLQRQIVDVRPHVERAVEPLAVVVEKGFEVGRRVV